MKISTLVKKYPDLFPGRLAIRLSYARKCFFVPWYYVEDKQIWVGETRWWGNNNKSIDYARRFEKISTYTFFRKVPILPWNHPIRKKLEREVHFNTYRNELINNLKTKI